MAYGQNITVPNFANATGQNPAERWRFSTLNDMLLSIDQPGIDYNSSIMDTAEGQHALRILTDVMYEVESEGWEYNTLHDVTLTLDNDGKYTFGVTQAMPLGASYIFSLVGDDDDVFIDQTGVLHSRNLELSIDGTVLGEPNTEITVSEMIIEKWNAMHFALTQYVAAMAINRYQAFMVGDATQASFTQQDLATKYGNARRDEIRSGKYNMLDDGAGPAVRRR